MKARVSHILKALAVLLFVVGIVALFIYVPIRASSYEQKDLYASSVYQYLAKSGVATKAVVTSVTKGKDSTINLLVKFFNREGATVEAYIPLTKQVYAEGDLINIVYNANNLSQARIAPADETTLNWQLFGWCIVLGIMLYWIGHFRHKVSGGIE